MADEELSTDEAILDNMDIGGDGNDDASPPEGTETPPDTGSEALPEPGSTPPISSGGEQPPSQQAPGANDLLGPNGQVIAKAGAERRLYERASKSQRDLDTANASLTAAQDTITSLEAAGGLGTQYNLSADELSGAAQLMAAIKQDPTQAINYLITQASAAGHNIEGMSNSLDAKALSDMIDTKLQPLVGEQQARADTQARNAEGEVAYNSFMTQFPDAAVHADTLASMLEDSSISPEAAYYKLRNFYMENRLDWNKSVTQIQQDIAAAKANPTGSTLPTGTTPADDLTGVDDAALTGNVNDSYDDIIRGSMKEAGVIS
jgi:hypothetical protein